MKFSAYVFVIIVFTLNFFAQNDKIKFVEFVEVPRDIVLQVVAVQPNCPIRFENVRYLSFVTGGTSNSYELRNVGSKPIRSVTVASSTGAINTYARASGVVALPGALVAKASNDPTLCADCPKVKIVSLTDELRERLSLKPPMHAMVVLMVVEVEFTDGTRFNDQKTYDAMETYVDKLDDALRRPTAKPALNPGNI